MAPKVAIGAEEDVKFLLTIIKQLEGTVCILFVSFCVREVQHRRSPLERRENLT
jgi:hypothetical protein